MHRMRALLIVSADLGVMISVTVVNEWMQIIASALAAISSAIYLTGLLIEKLKKRKKKARK